MEKLAEQTKAKEEKLNAIAQSTGSGSEIKLAGLIDEVCIL